MTLQIRIDVTCEERVCQGDILGDVEHIEAVDHTGEFVEVTKTLFPRIIVLTQDCDLEQDFRFRRSDPPKPTQDKFLVSVLVAPLYTAEHVFAGEHLSLLNLTMSPIPKTATPGKTLMQNETPRYYYLPFTEASRLPPLIIDFKHYFSVNVEYLNALKRKTFICKVSELFRESISLRFANYLSRIGLPETPLVEKAKAK